MTRLRLLRWLVRAFIHTVFAEVLILGAFCHLINLLICNLLQILGFGSSSLAILFVYSMANVGFKQSVLELEILGFEPDVAFTDVTSWGFCCYSKAQSFL